jgi:hypothetical protein
VIHGGPEWIDNRYVVRDPIGVGKANRVADGDRGGTWNELHVALIDRNLRRTGARRDREAGDDHSQRPPYCYVDHAALLSR